MTHMIDKKIKNFIDKELSEISQDKDRVTEEKRRVRTEIFQLYKVEHSERTPNQNKRLEVLQNYDDMLVKQYDLLCKRDIALFQMVAGIGEMSMESECRVKQEIDDKINRQANFSKIDYTGNLRYVIGDTMKIVFGTYNSNYEDKFGEVVGVGKGVIRKLLRTGVVAEKDFNDICDYLNPPEDIKKMWRFYYVNDSNLKRMNSNCDA